MDCLFRHLVLGAVKEDMAVTALIVQEALSQILESAEASPEATDVCRRCRPRGTSFVGLLDFRHADPQVARPGEDSVAASAPGDQDPLRLLALLEIHHTFAGALLIHLTRCRNGRALYALPRYASEKCLWSGGKLQFLSKRTLVILLAGKQAHTKNAMKMDTEWKISMISF